MKRPTATCTNCKERVVGCHAECEKYKKYVKDLKEYNEYWKKKRKNSTEADKFRHEGLVNKMKRKEGK